MYSHTVPFGTSTINMNPNAGKTSRNPPKMCRYYVTVVRKPLIRHASLYKIKVRFGECRVMNSLIECIYKEISIKQENARMEKNACRGENGEQ